MGVLERRLRQQEEMKNQIIACSREIVNEEGWAALSIRRIADAIEYSVPVIYKHFENKEAITAYFIQEGFENLLAEIKSVINPKDSVEERFQQMAEGYYLFAKNFPKHYEIMFAVGIQTCEAARKVPALAELNALTREMISEIIKKGEKDHLDACLKYRTFCSILHGVIAFELLTLHDNDQVCALAALRDAVDGFCIAILK